MDQVEHAIRVLSHQGEAVDDKGRRQHGREVRGQGVPDGIRVRGPASQGHVKAELLHHIRIPPTLQQHLLRCGEACLATARQLSLSRSRAEWVERRDSGTRQIGQSVRGLSRYKRHEGPQPPNLQRRDRDRKLAGAKCGGGFGQGARVCPICQSERWLDRAVKPILSRCSGQRIDAIRQPRYVWMRTGAPGLRIPAQPRSPCPVKRAVWDHVDTISAVIFHSLLPPRGRHA